MTLSDRSSSLHARKQAGDDDRAAPIISGDTSVRPALRLVPGPAQVADPQPNPAEDHSAWSHAEAASEALRGQAVTSTHPPTVADAAADIWPERDHVRHGLAGQLASAAAGLAQVIGLGICWGAAHVFFASKTAAAITSLVLIAVLAAITIASRA